MNTFRASVRRVHQSGGIPIPEAAYATYHLGLFFELGKAIAATQALTFSGVGGQVLLDDAHDFHAGVTGFAHGDTVDLTGFSFSGEKFTYTPSGSGSTSGGTLAIMSGSNTASIALHGTYTSTQFHLASDGHGGTTVTYG